MARFNQGKDLTFNSGSGFNGGTNAVTLQPDGKILVGGIFTTYDGLIEHRIIRLNSDGSKDLTFDNSVGFDGAVYSIEEQIKMYGFEATDKAYELYPKFFEYGFDSLWNACSCNLGYFEPTGKKQEEWKKLIEAYSCEFFNSNIKYATYALKDAYNLDLWNKLINNYSSVNYLDIKEETSTIDIQGELACAGGACLVWLDQGQEKQKENLVE